MRQRQYTEGIKGFEVDIHKFIDDFVREVEGGACLNYATFKSLWKNRRMSFIIASPPDLRTASNYVQSIFMAILDRLDTQSPLEHKLKNSKKKALEKSQECHENNTPSAPERPVSILQKEMEESRDFLQGQLGSENLEGTPSGLSWVSKELEELEALLQGTDEGVKADVGMEATLPEHTSKEDHGNAVDQIRTADSVIPSPNDFSTIWLRTMGNSNNQISGENIEAQSQENYGQRSQEIEDRTLMEWSRTFQPLDSERRLSSLDAKDQIVVEPVEMSCQNPTAEGDPLDNELHYLQGPQANASTHCWDANIGQERIPHAPDEVGEQYPVQHRGHRVPLETKVAALFAVYTTYKVQIFEPRSYIHVPFSILCEFVAMVPELQYRGLWDACEILKALVDEDAFVFGKYRRPSNSRVVLHNRTTCEKDVGRELMFHLRTSLKGACNPSGIRLHSKRYNNARKLLSGMGSWATNLLGRQGTAETIYDCSIGDRLMKMVREQQELIEECIADDCFRHVRRPAILINHHHRKSLEYFDGHGEVDLTELDVGTHLLPKKKSRPRQDAQEEQSSKVKRKRTDGRTNKLMRNKLRLLNRETLAECEPEERDMLKTLPPAARQVVLRDIRRKKSLNGNAMLEATGHKEIDALDSCPISGHVSLPDDSENVVPTNEENNCGQIPAGSTSRVITRENGPENGPRCFTSQSLKIVRSLRSKHSQDKQLLGTNTRVGFLSVSAEDDAHLIDTDNI